MKNRFLPLVLFFLTLWVIFPVAYPTVLCKFRGQIGNQFFEAATTIAYAKDHHHHPIFRAKSLLTSPHSKKNISFFFHKIQFDNFFAKLSYKMGMKRHFIEKNARTYKQIPPARGLLTKGLLLEGYFQSEKYFAHHRDTLLKLFTPPKEIETIIDQQYGPILRENETVALHVRTFIQDHQEESKIPQKWDYYQKAVDSFPDHCLLIVFSDYPEYAKEHLKIQNKKVLFIENTPYEFDFWLMNQCHHFIVAPNSTFSWWAAWLSDKPNKRVLCEGNTLSDPDYYPDAWETVSF